MQDTKIYLKNLLERFSLSVEVVLLIANVALVAGLIFAQNLGLLPIAGWGNFVFLVVMVWLFALWRPRWAFWFLVGVVPLELVNLAPLELGIGVRPYQLLAGVLVGALIVRALSGRLERDWWRWNWADTAVAVLVTGGFVAVLGAPETGSAIVQAVIVTSFALIYFLARYFVRGPVSVMMPLKFGLGSAVIVAVYAIWQNWRFAQNLPNFEVMSGRPNATFGEPDWLGLFVVMVLAVLFGLIWHFAQIAQKQEAWRRLVDKLSFDKKSKEDLDSLSNLNSFAGNENSKSFAQIVKLVVAQIGIWLLAVLVLVVLIITVARSAWVGAVAVALVFAGVLVWRQMWRALINVTTQLVVALAVALMIIASANLTTFELGARVVSTGGAQEITVACSSSENAENLRKFVTTGNSAKLADISQLAQFDCRHIDLEAIAHEKAQGQIVLRVLRADLSIGVRADIYRQSMELLRSNWLLGIGWGSDGYYLGTDTHDNQLNVSNIFLQVWLGTGLIGLIAFVILLGTIATHAIKRLAHSSNLRNFTFALITLLSIIAITTPNLFNAGLLTGWVWLVLGIVASVVIYRR